MNEDQACVEAALRGELLYGDDFGQEEIDAWFEEEREGYFNLHRAGRPVPGAYEFGALAQQHGFRWLPACTFDHALGIGSADGAELAPLAPRTRRISILEPSEGYSLSSIGGTPVTYVKPHPSGRLPFPAGTCDLIVGFNVLHHVPNVSTVIGEMYRVLEPGGFVLLREPTHSMGDWRTPRRGLTPRERGIPLKMFREIVQRARFQIVRETRCMFSLTSRLAWFWPEKVWRSNGVVMLDRLLCALPVWPDVYHARNAIQKLRPTSVAYVLSKPRTAANARPAT